MFVCFVCLVCFSVLVRLCVLCACVLACLVCCVYSRVVCSVGHVLCRVRSAWHTEVVNDLPGHVELAQRELVVVFGVEHVDQVSVERVDVLQAGESLEHMRELLVEVLLRELDLAHVEAADAGDGISLVHDSRGLALGLAQDDVDEVLRLRHHACRGEDSACGVCENKARDKGEKERQSRERVGMLAGVGVGAYVL